MWFALSPLAAPVRSWSKPEEKVERPQPLVRKCVWERAQVPAFKQRRISSLPLLPSPASPSDSVELQQEADVSKQRGTFKVRSGCLPAGRGSARAA